MLEEIDYNCVILDLSWRIAHSWIRLLLSIGLIAIGQFYSMFLTAVYTVIVLVHLKDMSDKFRNNSKRKRLQK